MPRLEPARGRVAPNTGACVELGDPQRPFPERVPRVALGSHKVPVCRQRHGRPQALLRTHPSDSFPGGSGAGRAGGDITSNGPECGNTVNKVYFTFNFDI